MIYYCAPSAPRLRHRQELKSAVNCWHQVIKVQRETCFILNRTMKLWYRQHFLIVLNLHTCIIMNQWHWHWNKTRVCLSTPTAGEHAHSCPKLLIIYITTTVQQVSAVQHLIRLRRACKYPTLAAGVFDMMEEHDDKLSQELRDFRDKWRDRLPDSSKLKAAMSIIRAYKGRLSATLCGWPFLQDRNLTLLGAALVKWISKTDLRLFGSMHVWTGLLISTGKVPVDWQAGRFLA